MKHALSAEERSAKADSDDRVSNTFGIKAMYWTEGVCAPVWSVAG